MNRMGFYLLGVLLSPLVADEANAQSTNIFTFHVQPGPLYSVLNKISEQSGAKYRITQDVPATVKAGGVDGSMSLEAAVQTALKGTGWIVESIDAGQIRLRATSASEGVIMVFARRQGFKENFSSAATLVNTPLLQTPATVDVVTQDILQSRNATTLQSALRNIPGASFSTGNPAQINIGPSTTAGTTFTNGLRNGLLDDNQPVFLMENIEVVKGPSSLISGTQVSGALLNYIPKRANGVTPLDVTAGIGSGLEKSIGLDYSTRVPGVAALYFRMVAFAQHADTAPSGGNNPFQYVVSPMLGYRTNGTSIDIVGSVVRQKTVYPRADYLDAAGNITSYGAAYNPDQFDRTRNDAISYDLKQTAIRSGSLTLDVISKGRYESGRRREALVTLNAPVGQSYTARPRSTDTLIQSVSDTTGFSSTFKSGRFKNQTVVLLDLSLSWNRLASATGSLATPVQTVAPLLALPTGAPHSRELERQYGLTFQDQLSVGRFHLTLGMRNSWYRDTVQTYAGDRTQTTVKGTRAVDSDSLRHQSAEKWSPSASLVFDVNPSIALYGSYTETFRPNSALLQTEDGSLLPSTITHREEVGVKSELAHGRLNVNLSGYHLTTLQDVLTDPITYYNYSGPGQSEWGGQISIVGSITSTLKVTAGYTYFDWSSAQEEFPVLGAARNSVNLWMVKTVSIASRQTIDLGLGGNYRGGTFIYDTAKILSGDPYPYRRFDHDTYSLDASVGYHIGRLGLNLTVDNLLNSRNYQLPSSDTLLARDEGRSVKLFVDYKFK